MTASSGLAITIDRVTKRYADRLVLDDISFAITPGETVALIGPSGGGKSTLLRCINGLVPFEEGAVRVGEHTVAATNGSRPSGNANGADVRRLVGMVFQDFRLFPHLTALENVMEAPRRVGQVANGDAAQLAQRLLERVGLGDRGDAYPRQLSGGQQQRVAIARAMAMQPRGLLCDEITSALDPELKHEVLEVIEELKQDGLTLVLVTHEIGFARRAADRVVVLAGGKLIEEGPSAQVIDNPQVPRTQQFLSRLLA
ncbi:MAG: amino acid ABC transporter ATP-binding protein [Planctomycetaceae bacterium]|nr:amino acid ABC transporter ATP-binding protein [Planctomycetaceae bacterium]